MKESRYFIPKIIAGYLLLAAMCAAMIAYIYHKVDSSTAVDPVLSAIESRNAMIDRTLVGLYRAESRAQMILAGDDSYIALYDEDVEDSLACIDSLKNTVILSDDPVRAARLDTVSMLVNRKRRELLRLAQGLRDGSDASRIIERNIARLGERDAAAQDSLAASHSDTALVNMRRRKFFRRVAELFEIETDTTEHVAPAPVKLSDTIGGLLVDLQSQVERQREDSERRMTRIRREVTSANNQLDRRILDLIDEVRHDWDAHHARRRAERDAARRDAVSALGMVALSAIVLVFVFLAVILRDWRRSRRVRAELERANDEKQRLLDYREHLMLAVTHDLKAPAGSIMGYADLLERLDNDHRQRLYITGMKQSAEHLQTLIESLLEFYRLDDGRAEKESKPFNAARMMRDAARDAAASRHRRPEVEIGTHIDASADATVISDAMRIRRIVDNLLSNALKFTSRGTVTLACGIRGGELCISVTDTGCGMSAEECSRIFDSFVRLESAAGVEGFGLGLSIVERSVRLLAGSIDVESGKGARQHVPHNHTARHAHRDAARHTARRHTAAGYRRRPPATRPHTLDMPHSGRSRRVQPPRQPRRTDRIGRRLRRGNDRLADARMRRVGGAAQRETRIALAASHSSHGTQRQPRKRAEGGRLRRRRAQALYGNRHQAGLEADAWRCRHRLPRHRPYRAGAARLLGHNRIRRGRRRGAAEFARRIRRRIA